MNPDDRTVTPPSSDDGPHQQAAASKPLTLTREDIFTRIWSRPMRTVAAELGMSDVGLAKACRRMRIPSPERGYWARKTAGYKDRVPRLPNVPDDFDKNLLVLKIDSLPALTEEPVVPESVRKQREYEGREENRIIVRDDLRSLHPLVKKTAEILRHTKASDDAYLRESKEEYLDLRVSKACLTRGLRILNAIVVAAAARGWRTSIKKDDREMFTEVTVLDIPIRIVVREKQKRVENPPPKRVRSNYDGQWYTPLHSPYSLVPSGLLSLAILWFGRSPALEWRDGKTQRIEDMLNDFMVVLVEKAEYEKERERERIESDRQRREVEALRQAEHERREREKAQRKLLVKDSRRWRTSRRILAFLDDLEQRSEIAGIPPTAAVELQQWIASSRARAHALDPVDEIVKEFAEEDD